MGRIIDASESRCTEEDLVNSIGSVKNNLEIIDMEKPIDFLATLTFGDVTLRNVIQKVGRYAVK